MEDMDKDSYELGKDVYIEVLACLRKKDKSMFKLLNKSREKYKDAIYWYLWRIIRYDEIPRIFQMTWLTSIWKKKGSAIDLNMMRYIHT